MATLEKKQKTMVTLTYFHGWGLAEQTRWVLAAAEVPFENVCLDTHAQFLALKEGGNLLFGQLPLLEIDGLELVQSQAMVRYVAARGGGKLIGDTPAECALVDMVAEAVRDARGIVVGTPFASDRAEHLAKLQAVLDKYLPKFEAVLATAAATAAAAGGSGDGGGILASGKLCYGDVLLGELLDSLEGLRPGCTTAPDGAAYPLLGALHKKILALPGVASYLASGNRFPFPTEGPVNDAYVQNVYTVLGR